MARTHYETLGVKREASAEEIRKAFRGLVLLHHPDRSKAKGAAERFMQISNAYEVLREPKARDVYDKLLAVQEAKAVAAEEPPPPRTVPRASAPETVRLASLFSRGRFAEAEQLAQTILSENPREALAYAILGDIARARGEINHASNLYAHAIQMNPREPTYQQRYDELLNRAGVTTGETAIRWNAMVGFVVPVLGAIYLAVAQEPLIGQWTYGLLVMTLISGIAAGVSLSLAGLLDNFLGTCFPSGRRVAPGFIFLMLGLCNFWVGAAGYALFGLARGAFSLSVTRAFLGVGCATMIVLMGCTVSPVISAGMMALWGGNIILLGMLLGWMISDIYHQS